ncbi:hypothetical protein C2845_PM01G02690 [Panicum miliaceum]|uniref:No apical meristem-associated C-terminal domain-containing protein n=1 Tax=Panicum miliaceum TaxID=4540 RepID=A0A3L6TWC9_PANMI|nr:hypothetical protein C2845_PM01G02690 [Panicum miliaceum]
MAASTYLMKCLQEKNTKPYWQLDIQETNEIIDRLFHVQKLYKLKESKNRPFVMLHCWTLLEHNEKWNNRDNDCHPLKKRAGNSSFTEFENEGDGNEDEEESGSPRLGPPNKKRLSGRKQEKERIKRRRGSRKEEMVLCFNVQYKR